MKILYEFYKADNKFYKHLVDLERRNTLPEMPILEVKDWINLDYHKCPVCPLNSDSVPYCPAAYDISEATDTFCNIYSYDKIKVVVTTERRYYFRYCDASEAINSLLGLIMASSGCPILSNFKAMAEFHLPFSSFEESLVRTTGIYLLKQYYAAKEGKQPDIMMKGLEKLYSDINIINFHLKLRLEEVSKKDANLNAIVNFFALSTLIGQSLETQLEEIREIIK